MLIGIIRRNRKNMLCRIKKINDFENVILIAESLLDFFTIDGVGSLKEDLKSHELYGALVDDKLVGFITLRLADTSSLEISWLAVLPGWQGKGVGTELIKETLNIKAKEGFKICYVKTLAETVPDLGYEKTRKFYKKLGFYTLEIIDPYPGWDEGNPCQILAASLPIE
jgi:ribosomal protein S18 acetylase RimI-like enzyme